MTGAKVKCQFLLNQINSFLYNKNLNIKNILSKLFENYKKLPKFILISN